MNVVAWRITKSKFAGDAFSGEGARRFGGRWNSSGIPVVYTAQSQSLAALEILVNTGSPKLMAKYVAIPVTMDSELIESIEASSLPKNWNADPPPEALRAMGDDWIGTQTSVALRVPSCVIPAEYNYLLNPFHSDFRKLAIGSPVPFQFDRRLRGK